jgi:sugar lactone lactonase YvrE
MDTANGRMLKTRLSKEWYQEGNRTMKSVFQRGKHSFTGTVCAGAFLLITCNALAQNLFVSQQAFSGPNILQYTPGGTKTTFASGGLNLPYALAFSSAGDLYLADAGNNSVYKYTPGGTRTTFASGLLQPSGLAFDTAGNLFVQEDGTGPVNSGRISMITPGGVRTTFATGLNPAGPSIAFDSAGNLFMSDIQASSIYKFAPNGTMSTFATLDPAVFAFGLQFDSAGNLFASAVYQPDGSAFIYKYTPGGARSTFATGMVGDLVSMAFDNGGNLYVANYDQGYIRKFTPGGVGTDFATGLTHPAGLAFQIPEPSIFALLALGAMPLMRRRRG